MSTDSRLRVVDEVSISDRTSSESAQLCETVHELKIVAHKKEGWTKTIEGRANSLSSARIGAPPSVKTQGTDEVVVRSRQRQCGDLKAWKVFALGSFPGDDWLSTATNAS